MRVATKATEIAADGEIFGFKEASHPRRLCISRGLPWVSTPLGPLLCAPLVPSA